MNWVAQGERILRLVIKICINWDYYSNICIFTSIKFGMACANYIEHKYV